MVTYLESKKAAEWPAPVLGAASGSGTAHRLLAGIAGRALGRARANLRGITAVTRPVTVTRSVDRGVAAAAGGAAQCVGIARLAATAIAEACLAAGTGAGHRLPAGSRVAYRVAAAGTVRAVPTVQRAGDLPWLRDATRASGADLIGGTTAARAAAAITATLPAAAARRAGCGWDRLFLLFLFLALVLGRLGLRQPQAAE